MEGDLSIAKGRSDEGLSSMKPYNIKLKGNSRILRNNLTDAEQLLWFYIRRKQVRGVSFYRQKPLLQFIVDFYCAVAMLVIELDGSQHHETERLVKDKARDAELAKLGLLVLRFDNWQIIHETQSVLAVIDETVRQRIGRNLP
jgi:very-short-patch-repair endonuclease